MNCSAQWTCLSVVCYLLWKDGNGFCCLTIRKRHRKASVVPKRTSHLRRHEEHTCETDGAVERCMLKQMTCDVLPSYSCREFDNPLRLQELMNQQNKLRFEIWWKNFNLEGPGGKAKQSRSTVFWKLEKAPLHIRAAQGHSASACSTRFHERGLARWLREGHKSCCHNRTDLFHADPEEM